VKKDTRHSFLNHFLVLFISDTWFILSRTWCIFSSKIDFVDFLIRYLLLFISGDLRSPEIKTFYRFGVYSWTGVIGNQARIFIFCSRKTKSIAKSYHYVSILNNTHFLKHMKKIMNIINGWVFMKLVKRKICTFWENRHWRWCDFLGRTKHLKILLQSI